MSTTSNVLVYGRQACDDTRRTLAFLEASATPFSFLAVDESPAAAEEAVRISGGAAVPVVVLPDGSHLVEPADDELRHRLPTT